MKYSCAQIDLGPNAPRGVRIYPSCQLYRVVPSHIFKCSGADEHRSVTWLEYQYRTSQLPPSGPLFLWTRAREEKHLATFSPPGLAGPSLSALSRRARLYGYALRSGLRRTTVLARFEPSDPCALWNLPGAPDTDDPGS